MSEQDYELLSSYIDGTLDETERGLLEARLSQDAELRRELAAMRQTVLMVKGLPKLKAPRDFTVTQAMLNKRQPRLLMLFPVLSAAAAMILVFLGITMLFGARLDAPQSAVNQVASVSTSAPTAAALEMMAPAFTGEAFEESQAESDDAALSRMAGTEDAQTQLFEEESPAPAAADTGAAGDTGLADTAVGGTTTQDTFPLPMPTQTQATKIADPTIAALAAQATVLAPEVTEEAEIMMFSAPEITPEILAQTGRDQAEDEAGVREDEPQVNPNRLAVPLIVTGLAFGMIALALFWKLRQ